MKGWITKVRPYVKPFCFVSLIYAIALLSILRFGVSFNDDIERAVFGNAWDNDFNRFSSSFLARILNSNFELMDISPWTQIIAIIILSITSLVFVYILCNKKIKYLPLLCSVFIGIQPFAIECWLYKFDAPCIALSILVSVIPFLFWPEINNKKGYIKFFIISVFCLLLMWTSYQAASGIYVLMCLFMVLKDISEYRRKKEIMKVVLLGVLAYVVAAAIFKFCLPGAGGYRQTEILPVSGFAVGVLKNIKEYLLFINQNLTKLWKVLLILSVICFVVVVLIKNKKRLLSTAILMSVSMILSLVLSLGAYLILDNMPLNGRSFVGIGVVLAAMMVYMANCLYESKQWMKLLAIAPAILLYSFCAFCLALGNGLADQERYGIFRTEEVLQGLANTISVGEEEYPLVQIRGGIGYSGVMQHVIDLYPVAKTIVTDQQVGISLAQYGIARARFYYGKKWNFKGVWEEQFDCEKMDLIDENIYHSIRSSGEKVCVDVYE